MLKRDYDGQNCSIARTLEIVGERWTLLIVRDAYLGRRRFDEFQESLGISRNVLAERLKRLVDDGILERVPYQEHPARYEYRLTQKGRDLRVALTALRQWGDTYISEKPPTLLRSKADKRPVIAALIPADQPRLRVDDVESVPGPGS
ncbi:MAG TPA: helix-turn-helix domain-containing protein [Gaiellaceae bacterium]|nr:helix-turn-helix domain-containing protein [Gaiellaceae bacterium]